jgi:hypothetical protein
MDINKVIAPNIIQHPVFQSDPFSATSPNPLLKTTSSPLQIRKCRGGTGADHNSSGVSSREWERNSDGSKNKFLFDGGSQAPNDRDSPCTGLRDLMLGGPSATLNSLSYALIQNREARKPTNSDVNTASGDSIPCSRGISSLFKQRDKPAERSAKECGGAKSDSECDEA